MNIQMKLKCAVFFLFCILWVVPIMPIAIIHTAIDWLMEKHDDAGRAIENWWFNV